MLLQLFCFNVILNMIAIIDKIVKIIDDINKNANKLVDSLNKFKK